MIPKAVDGVRATDQREHGLLERTGFTELLKIDEDTELPGIVFFNTCRQIISDLPVIPSDPRGSDDIDPRLYFKRSRI